MTGGDTTTRVVSESGDDVGPGQRLREARAAAQLTVAEVASRMRLETYALEQLENDDYERLHGSTFVRGYLSGYARLLGLPAGPILEAYERQGYGPPALVSELGRKPEVHVSDFPVRMVTYVIAGLLVVLVVLWWQNRQFPTAIPARVEVADRSVPQDSGSPAIESEPADQPVTTDVTASLPATAGTSESPVEEVPSRTAVEGDTPPPQATTGTAPVDASETALMQTPASEGAGVEASSPNTKTDTDNTATSGTPETVPGDESVAEAGNQAQDLPESQPEMVVLLLDSTDSTDSTDTVDGDAAANPTGLEEEAVARPAPLPGSDVLAIELATESWVEIYDRGGGRLFYSLAQEGSEIVVQGAGPMRVLLGAVEGAVVAYNGEPYDLSRYQGRSVVHFTVGELSSTTAPEPPAAEEPLTRETREPTADERGPSVADASGALSTPVPDPAAPGSPPTAEPVPEAALPAPAAGDTPEPGTRSTRPDS